MCVTSGEGFNRLNIIIKDGIPTINTFFRQNKKNIDSKIIRNNFTFFIFTCFQTRIKDLIVALPFIKVTKGL